MAKKATAKKVEVAPQEIETPQYVEPTPQKVAKAPKWEIKDRLYELIGDSRPVVRIMKRNTLKHQTLFYFHIIFCIYVLCTVYIVVHLNRPT